MAKVSQSLAPNSTPGHMDDMPYDAGDRKKIMHNEMPNNRMHGYLTDQFAGPGHHTKAKVKGHTEHGKQEDELGNDYGN